MAGTIKESLRINPFGMLREAVIKIKVRIRLLNPGQKKVFFGLLIFMLVNAIIMVASIVVFSLMIKKL